MASAYDTYLIRAEDNGEGATRLAAAMHEVYHRRQSGHLLRVSITARRGENVYAPCVGSEPHVAPSVLKPFQISPILPSNALARANPLGEGAAPEWRATNLCPRPLKQPDAQAVQKAGVVTSVPGESPAFLEDIDTFGLAGMVENVHAGGSRTRWRG